MRGRDDRPARWLSIPAELRALPQWCVSTLLPHGEKGKEDKAPRNARTGGLASVTDPSTWSTFEQALATCQAWRETTAPRAEVGFVLSANDPFFVVDLDTYKSQVPENHELLLEVVETYAERSQSGEGAHVIGVGVVGRGRNSRYHGIEVYDHARFIITTGDRINDFGIVPDQDFADKVVELLGPIADAEALHYPASQPSDESDADLIERIERAENGRKFTALCAGNVWLQNGKDDHLCALQDALVYESQSEADIALIEMLCFFTGDDEQVARIFHASALGQREKARRRDYVPRSIRSARGFIASNKLPLLDFSALLARARSNGTQRPSGSNRIGKRRGIILTRVSDVMAQEISWLWRVRIALGKVTVIAGPPGLGKSQLTAFLAAMVTTGGAWPNDEGLAPMGAVIMLSCEDDIADTIRPRLEAAGADVSKVHVVEGVNSKGGDRKVFSVKQDMPLLEEALDRVEGVNLVVIDPITAYLDGSDSHNTGDVRAALAPLQELAMRRGIAVVVVSHLNKSGGQGRSVNAVTGSIAFVAASRATFLVEKDAEEPERRFLLEVKNNLAKSDGLAFRIRERKLPNGIPAPYLEFEPGTVEITADEALGQGGGSGRGGSALQDASLFIIEQLRGGPVPAAEMQRRAEQEGIARKTLRKAQADLGVISRKDTGANGVWIWSLPQSGLMSKMPQHAPTK